MKRRLVSRKALALLLALCIALSLVCVTAFAEPATAVTTEAELKAALEKCGLCRDQVGRQH